MNLTLAAKCIGKLPVESGLFTIFAITPSNACKARRLSAFPLLSTENNTGIVILFKKREEKKSNHKLTRFEKIILKKKK